MKYLILGLVQLLLFVVATPVVVGVLVGLLTREKGERRLWRYAVALIVLINVAVWIDKGRPFFTAQVLDIYLPFALSTGVKLAVGVVGDTLLCIWFRRLLETGYKSGLHLMARGSAGSGR
jgi:Na+/melibiose symporter-like transporter